LLPVLRRHGDGLAGVQSQEQLGLQQLLGCAPLVFPDEFADILADGAEATLGALGNEGAQTLGQRTAGIWVSTSAI
jgi:hypothetical protein